MVKVDKFDSGTCICLQPNRSASWRQTKYLVCSISSLSLLIAIAWSFAGAWVILPFAGLEVGLLFFLAFKVSALTYQQELILIHQGEIEVQCGQRYPKRKWHFCKDKCQVLITKPDHSLSTDQFVLKDQHLQLEIGRWLNKEDKVQLKQLLQRALLPVKTIGQHKTIALHQ